jgi:Icc-related predicted phosphoesterase
MRTLVVIGDVHDERERLETVLDLVADRPADLAILTGDVGRDPPRFLTRRRADHDASVRAVLARVRKRCACPVAFVPGNHDLPRPADAVVGVNVDGCVATLAGLRVAGLGGSTRTRMRFPYEWSEDEAAASLTTTFAGCDEPVDVFLSHTPPRDTALDVTALGQSVGSVSVGTWIERVRPRLFVCGHIHEAFGVQRLHGVPCLNAGALGEPFGRELIWRVDWDDGPTRIESFESDRDGGVSRRAWGLTD